MSRFIGRPGLPAVICLLFVFGLTAQVKVAQISPTQAQAGGSHLGLKLVDVDAERLRALDLKDSNGALIVAVEENGCADQAGLRAGDVILRYNGEGVLGAKQLGRLVAETPPGRNVSIRIWRDGKAKDILVTTVAPSNLYWTSGDPAAMGFITDVPAPLMVWRNMILGFDYEPLNTQLAQFFGVKQGALVRSVEPASLADKSGLKAGDILTGVAGRSILTPRDLGAAIKEQEKSRRPLLLDVTRARKAITVSVPVAVEQ